MFYRYPDPHPGRCLNHRTDPGDPYRVKQLRCLEMEGHPSACRFPPPSIAITQDSASFDQSTPQPWKVPE